jgi:hypothetical protein
MARKFFYVAMGILALAVVFHLGAITSEGPDPALADHVDHLGTGIVALKGSHALDEYGQVWQWAGGWTRAPDRDPPVPVNEVKLWESDYLITTSDEGFTWSSVSGWVSYGQWPGAGTRVSDERAVKTTWSEVKAEFK